MCKAVEIVTNGWKTKIEQAFPTPRDAEVQNVLDSLEIYKNQIVAVMNYAGTSTSGSGGGNSFRVWDLHLVGCDYSGVSPAANGILEMADNLISNYFACKGSKRFAPPTVETAGDWEANNAINGRIAHFAIQYWYANVFKPNDDVQLEYIIPQASSKGTGNFGYADIVNKTTKEIFEIKTFAGGSYGDTEVGTYVEMANKFCKDAKPLNFNRGMDFPIKIELPWIDGNSKFIVYKNPKYAGVIAYDITLLTKQPSPIILPTVEWQAYKKLLLDMATNLNNAANLAKTFIKEHPGTVAILVTTGIIEFTTGAISAVASGGLSVPSYALVVAGGILINVALNQN